MQFITVFLASFLAGTLLNQASALLSNPKSFIDNLGKSAPLTSVFFLTFIALNVRPPPGSRLGFVTISEQTLRVVIRVMLGRGTRHECLLLDMHMRLFRPDLEVMYELLFVCVRFHRPVASHPRFAGLLGPTSKRKKQIIMLC